MMMLGETQSQVFEQRCFAAARRTEDHKMLIQVRQIVPDIMGTALEFGRKADRISRDLLSRSGIETDLDKDLFKVERICSSGADPLHIQITMLIAEITAIPVMGASKEEAKHLFHAPSACFSPVISALFPHFFEVDSETEQQPVGQQDSCCKCRIASNGRKEGNEGGGGWSNGDEGQQPRRPALR